MNAAVLLAFAEKGCPRAVPLMKRFFVERLVPANRTLGIKVLEVAPDSRSVILRLPYRRRILNPAGTVHGAAIMALAETVHGVAVLWQFSPYTHQMVAKRSTLEFLRPGRGDLFVRFGLAPELKASIERVLAAEGRAEFELESVVVDRQDQEIAHLQAAYVLRRRQDA
jgi:uncharacterized protein (TIGR00369 family)